MIVPSDHRPVPTIVGLAEQARRGTWRETWMTSVADRAAIIELLNSIEAQDIVEIGVHEGYTAACLLENVESIKRYRGVDVLYGYVTGLASQQTEVSLSPSCVVNDARFELILRRRGSFDLSTEDIGACDVMFIDGDHSRAGLLHDNALAHACVRSGGMILWHDCCEEWENDVQAVLGEMVVDGQVIRHVDGTRIAYQMK